MSIFNKDETITWRVRPSEAQKLYVLEFLEKHPQLASCRRNYERSTNAQNRRELWNQLTEELNNIGHAYKTVDTWQKYWRDQRAFVRERHIAYTKSGNGGARNQRNRNRVKPLNDYEKRVLALIMPDQPEFFVVEYVDSDTDNNTSCPKLELDEEVQLETSYDASKLTNHLSIKQSPPSTPTSPSSVSHIKLQQSPSPPASTSSSIPNNIKSIRSLLCEDEKLSHKRSGNGKRIRLERELERKTIALLEKNEEFNREMEIKKLEVEKEKVEALKELITVVRLGFACIAGQQLK